ncbi:MAG: ATPase [Gammaproteobacteria bacterium]|jgi:V/A-type H+-transporting ATPase subunit K|nr:ATPase [Gammaproteobacteria bacterium]MBT3724297.1 ATPase [Gammaproteobacteria bacterium]MBT4078214.1 ATPase [Gammaproteobacteria bacterium]MBT4196690.1 ATPase [Gammaproteobacteria bacterium]MBT4448513.1 ATPase [Gammaproteobacteria bacterium]
MSLITILLTLSVVGIMSLGIYLLMFPQLVKQNIPRWVKGSVVANLAIFALGIVGILIGSVNEAVAAQTVAGEVKDISIGLGLALVGIGLPTGLAAIGAGLAVGSVGSASLAVIVEKPELFGRTLIYLGLAEGIAIYGLVVSILLLGKI